MSAGMSEKLNNATESLRDATVERFGSVAPGKQSPRTVHQSAQRTADEKHQHVSQKRTNDPQSREARTSRIGGWARILKMLAIGTPAQELEALPICSFGPGGSYLVDWRVNQAAESARRGEARTLAAGIERIAESLTLDLKGWLLAEHPERQHRIDAAPETLNGCPLCGHENQWPNWFVNGHQAPDQTVILTGLRVAEDLKSDLVADPIASAVVEEVRARRSQEAQRDYESLEPVNGRAGFNISAAIGIAEVKSELKKEISASSSCLVGKGSESAEAATAPEPEKINYAEGSWETENTGPFLFRFSDNLEPVSFRLPTVREQAHDADTKATQNSDHDPGLSRSERLLANHAGTGRSTQRLKGNHLRTRRSARAERPSSTSPEQGTLFGDQSDGQAA